MIKFMESVVEYQQFLSVANPQPISSNRKNRTTLIYPTERIFTFTSSERNSIFNFSLGNPSVHLHLLEQDANLNQNK